MAWPRIRCARWRLPARAEQRRDRSVRQLPVPFAPNASNRRPVPPGLPDPARLWHGPAGPQVRPSKTLALKRGSIRESPLSDRQAERDAAALHAGAAAIRFDGVTVDFPVTGGATYPAVTRTDLKIGTHEFVAIVGPTGCGKSTLLNVAAGLLAADDRPDPDIRRAARGPQPACRLPLPAGRGDAVEDGARQRRHQPRDRRRGARRSAGARAGLAQARRACRRSATAIRTSFPAGRGSASASPRC